MNKVVLIVFACFLGPLTLRAESTDTEMPEILEAETLPKAPPPTAESLLGEISSIIGIYQFLKKPEEPDLTCRLPETKKRRAIEKRQATTTGKQHEEMPFGLKTIDSTVIEDDWSSWAHEYWIRQREIKTYPEIIKLNMEDRRKYEVIIPHVTMVCTNIDPSLVAPLIGIDIEASPYSIPSVPQHCVEIYSQPNCTGAYYKGPAVDNYGAFIQTVYNKNQSHWMRMPNFTPKSLRLCRIH